MKKLLSLMLSAAIACSMAVPALASTTNDFGDVEFAGAWDEDYETLPEITLTNGRIAGDGVAPNQTIYIALDDSVDIGTDPITDTYDLIEDDYFKFSTDKDTNAKMISSVKLLTEKSINSTRYNAVLEIVLADSTSTEEIHTDGEFVFTAKKDSDSDTSVSINGTFTKGDELVIPYSFWISNEKVSNDDNPDAGSRVYFSPDSNDTNTLTWGDDRAALQFDADDDASDFYARLSTSADSSIYSEYGDPVDAELWFYDFVGSPSIPSTSRATLTLGVPWDDDDDYIPDPESCLIYTVEADGSLKDVTASFTYSEDDFEVPGWSIKTRTLGTYVLSDTELETEVYDDTEEEPSDTTDSSSSVTDEKEIPQTGSSDLVNVAVMGAVVSLAVAGALAFRKASR